MMASSSSVNPRRKGALCRGILPGRRLATNLHRPRRPHHRSFRRLPRAVAVSFSRTSTVSPRPAGSTPPSASPSILGTCGTAFATLGCTYPRITSTPTSARPPHRRRSRLPQPQPSPRWLGAANTRPSPCPSIHGTTYIACAPAFVARHRSPQSLRPRRALRGLMLIMA